jgi:hypothetical protein
MEWQKVLADAVKDGTIRELHLSKIPQLKTCNNWREVEPIGLVDHKMKYSHYRGGLVKLNDKLYFVTDKTITAINEFIKLEFRHRINVVE